MEPAIEESPAETVETNPHEGRFSFSLRTLLWITAVICVSLGVGNSIGQFNNLESLGLFCGLILVLLALLLRFRKILGIVVLILFAIILLAVKGAYPAVARSQSRNQAKQQSLTFHAYLDIHGHFPPSYTADSDGIPLHSWRTLCLPFLEEQALYKSLDLNKAWDVDANKNNFFAVDLALFQSPYTRKRIDSKNQANYFSIVDKTTVWNPSAPVRLGDISDNWSNTVVLIEVLNRDVPWYEPQDLTLEEAINILIGEVDGQAIRPGYFVSKRIKGDGLNSRCVGFADAHAEMMYPVANREIARAMLTYNGGETLPTDYGQILREQPPEVIGYIIHWGRISSVAMYITLTLLPFWWKRRPKTGESTLLPNSLEPEA